MSEDAGGLRVSDGERDAAAHELREHFAVGRLDVDELHERLDRVYAAKTREQLAAVTADLPQPSRPVPVRPPAPRRHPGWVRFVRVNAICWSVWAIPVATAPAHHVEGMWPLWVTLPWGAALLTRRHRHG